MVIFIFISLYTFNQSAIISCCFWECESFLSPLSSLLSFSFSLFFFIFCFFFFLWLLKFSSYLPILLNLYIIVLFCFVFCWLLFIIISRFEISGKVCLLFSSSKFEVRISNLGLWIVVNLWSLLLLLLLVLLLLLMLVLVLFSAFFFFNQNISESFQPRFSFPFFSFFFLKFSREIFLQFFFSVFRFFGLYT